MEGSTKGLQLSMYNEKRWNLTKGASLPGFSVEKVRREDNVNWLGDVLAKSLRIRLLEEYPSGGDEMEH